MNICKLFSKVTESKASALFNDIIGYNDVKRLVRMALNSDEKVSILLSGPPASAKTMFLESLSKLKGSYFVDGGTIKLLLQLNFSKKQWLNFFSIYQEQDHYLDQ